MVAAFERLFKRAGIVPWKLVTDAGKDFTAKSISMCLQKFICQISPLSCSL
jgi:hypothetical protein